MDTQSIFKSGRIFFWKRKRISLWSQKTVVSLIAEFLEVSQVCLQELELIDSVHQVLREK